MDRTRNSASESPHLKQPGRSTHAAPARPSVGDAVARTVSAIDVVRESIAFDLHDGVLSRLSGVAYLTDTLARSAASERDRELAESVATLLRGLGDELRAYVEALRRPSAPATRARLVPIGTLLDQLEVVAREARLTHGADVRVDVARAVRGRLTPDAADHLLMIVREAVANALHHGGPGPVTVTLARTADGPSDAGSGDVSGIGRASLAARARALGGVVRLEVSQRDGTRLSLDAPIASLDLWSGPGKPVETLRCWVAVGTPPDAAPGTLARWASSSAAAEQSV